MHRKRRQAFSAFFTHTNIAAAAPMVWDKVDKLLSNIDEQIQRDGVAEMRTNASALATDVVAAYCLEGSLGLLENEEKAKEWMAVLTSFTDVIPIAKHFSWLIPLSASLPYSLVLKISPMMSRVVDARIVNPPVADFS